MIAWRPNDLKPMDRLRFVRLHLHRASVGECLIAMGLAHSLGAAQRESAVLCSEMDVDASR